MSEAPQEPSSAVEHWLTQWDIGSELLALSHLEADHAMAQRARAVRGLLAAGVSWKDAAEMLGVSLSMIGKLSRDERGAE